ncbi:AT-rich interactive domain-containing protein 4A isoform X1 [Oncorhynchus tshawytscha]|uniref:AT-rich interactive domain-containing protein 4A isoform X1 n=1 Tax=Oncorhynchus tshawytscha TaxID=74940 RepID=UPI001C3CFE92|nr:AT-rich interactive domain-containing protein 4A isoform X1 [Oncorhynchus tshawytscha]
MKAADEPAYLTVGTEVSAKYRGAFCEAKIKTVKRTVKVKVMLKGDTTSQVVQDDQVKGQLRVGSTVEVKSAEGICSEATINKLTDASWYTVVFDDGDEKTLRRTSLCLKGERHFAESETLDQLPLTNPEHFGTPVIGKKGNRGGRRSSQAHANDDKESSSSDDDSEDRRRLNDDLLGKVASIQTGTDRTSWYLALVISPSCNDDLTVKKDQCLVRSFADSKFRTVARKEIHEVNMDSISKAEFSWRNGLDEAVHFLKTKVVPDSWKMDMSEILESSSSDEEEEDKEGKDEEEEEEKEDDDEPEDEADPEERDHFLQQLYKFMEDRGTPINKPPVLGYKDLNLFKLFRLVYQQGGCDKIESGSVWKQIYMDLGIPILNSAASYNVKTAYRKYLYGFEEYCRSACIVFRTIHHNEARPAPQSSQSQTEQKAAQVPEVKVKDKDKVGKGPTPPVQNESAAATEDKPSQEEAESGSESDKESHKDIASPRGRRRCTVTPVKAEVKEPVKLEKIKEQEPSGLGVGETSGEETDGQKESSRSDGADTQGNGCSRRLGESDKESEDEGEDEDSERRVGEGAEDEDSEDSVTGTKVKVKYGRGKTQKIYEANIKKTENDDAGDVLYLVHYYGWNVRYDEWVKADRIIWPVDKGGTKNKQKKKVMNKEDGEKDKQGKLGGLRGRPLLRTTPPSANRSVSKTPSREGRSSSKSKSDTSPLPNGEGTPRRRTRRTSGMYDSDRDANSNDESGNSSEDSESEDSTEKKPAWAERTDPATARKQEEEEDLRVERGRAEAVAAAAAQAAAQLQPPSSPKEQQQEDKLPEREPEKVEAEEQPQTPPMTPEPDRPKEEDPPNLKSPRPKASRRSNVREPERNTNNTGSEIPTTPNHTETESFPSPCPLKRQDEPMVVLHCLPAEHLPSMPDLPIMDSDTDSAPEEEICREERGVAKRKATDHRTPDKKVRLEWREDTARMASPGARPHDSPGARPHDSPGARPNDSPGARPHDSPGARPHDSPGPRPHDSPGPRPHDSPGARPHDSPGARPHDSPGARPHDSPGARPHDSPGARPHDSPGARPHDSPGARPHDSPGARPHDSPGARPHDSPGARPHDSPGARPHDSPGARPHDSPGARPHDSPGARPHDSPGARPHDSPGARPHDSPGARPHDSPGARPHDSPGARPHDSPGGRPHDSPGGRPHDSPGGRPMTPERRLESGGLKEEECLKPAKGKTEPEVKTEMPALTPEVRCRGPGEGGVAGGQPRSEQPDYGAVEELMPQIGPEALVCHEVDLDDLDEKDKTSAEDLLMMMSQGKVHAPPPSNASSHHPQTHNNPPLSSGGAAPPQVFSPTSAPSPDESISTKSESDVTIEVDSVAGESQEGLGDNESAISNCFEANTSSSNSSMSLQERDTKDRGQKRLMDCNMSCSAKKQKRNQKRPSTTSKMEKNGAEYSSDSEDLAVMDPSCKMPPVKHSMSKGSLKLVSPNSKELEKDKHKHKQSSFPSPRTYKWTFQLNELDSMTSAERISFLQDKLQDIRKYYMSLKSEVASIDRRRKRLKKKEREVSHTTASTSSGSSDTGMSPSSASPTQNTVAVECR